MDGAVMAASGGVMGGGAAWPPSLAAASPAGSVRNDPST